MLNQVTPTGHNTLYGFRPIKSLQIVPRTEPHSIPWLLLCLGLLLGFSLQGAETSNNICLAQTYSVEKLRPILLPPQRWHPFPTRKDRQGWSELPEVVRTHLVQAGEAALTAPFPALPASLYLEYRRQGNRSRFEQVYFQRRSLLHNLVLAECLEGQGRFLEAAANALWAICEESSWCIPAHVGAQKAGTGLPDVTEPIVDLFAAETGVTVSWTLYLLGAELDRVSPRIRPRAELELSRRILNPVAERDNFGWMALNVSSPVHRPNNWTPWIAASVLTSALTSDTDAERRLQIVHKMLRSLDGFLRFHPADGSCDEGPGYWGHAGGSLLDGLELLQSATDGKMDLFGEPLIQEIGRFIYRAHICNDYWVPVGDCAARFEPERDVVFRYGRRLNDSTLKALGAQGATVEGLLGSRFLGREVNALFDAREILGFQPGTGQLMRDVWLPSEELQLMAARSQPGSSAGLFLAAWGGHNAQSHNHNDVGNFIVFANGQPVLIDPGAPTYTAQTFSARRYEIWAFQSTSHNLPTINGFRQEAGRQFAARNVKCETNAATAQLEMELGAAYPAKAMVKSWLRTVRLTRNQDIQVIEHFDLAEATGETSLNFMTLLEPDTRQPGLVTLGQTNKVRLEYDAATLMPGKERIALEDARLAKAWGPCLYRLVLRPKAPTRSGTWVLRIRQERGE